MVWKESGSRIPLGMTPVIIHAAASAIPTGSFFKSPLRVTDHLLAYVGFTLFDAGTKINGQGGSGATITFQDMGVSEVNVPDQPQWHENTPGGPFTGGPWSVRFTAFVTDGTMAIVPAEAIDVWHGLGTQFRFSMNRPPASTTHFYTVTYEFAPDADLADIHARATIRFEYQRP